MFFKRETIEQVEEGNKLAPKFDERGLIPVITSDYESGEVLMHGYMNDAALRMTLTKKIAVYYSRSRKVLWEKGKSSGFVQHVVEMRVDDDQDCLWLRVRVDGAASCHVGYRSCFYRRISLSEQASEGLLEFSEDRKVFDPKKVYGDVPNPTQL